MNLEKIKKEIERNIKAMNETGEWADPIEKDTMSEWIDTQIKDSVVQSVITKFKQRSEVGIKKYGTTMDRDDLTRDEWITHISEELMDALLYLEKLKRL